MPENENETDQNKDVNLEVKDDVQLETKDEEQQETKSDEQQSEQKEVDDTKVSIVDKIKNIIRRKPDNDTTDDADANAGTDDGADEGTDVPADFTTAALKAGMTVQQIKDFTSDYTDAELLEQIPYLLAQVSENSDESEQLSQKEAGDAQDAEKKDDERKSGDTDEKDEKIKLLEERLAKVEKGQETSTAKEAQDRFISMASRATKRMDELSKEFEVFGIYEKLPRFPHNNQIIPTSPQAKARNEVWGLACDLTNKAEMDFDVALEVSINAYKGKNLANDVKRNLVKDLKKSEKRLSAKHSAHESVKSDLSGPDVIREVGKKHGLEIR